MALITAHLNAGVILVVTNERWNIILRKTLCLFSVWVPSPSLSPSHLPFLPHPLLCLSVSVCLSVCLCLCLSLSVCLCLSVCLSLSLSLSLSLKIYCYNVSLPTTSYVCYLERLIQVYLFDAQGNIVCFH